MSVSTKCLAPGARLAAVAAVALWVLAPSAASAVEPQTKKQQTCVRIANKSAATIAKLQRLEASRCMAAEAKLGGSVDVATCSVADPKSKVDKAVDKADALLDGPNSKCLEAPDFGFATAADVTSNAVDFTASIFTTLFDDTIPGPLDGDARKCLGAMTKGIHKILGIGHAAFARCKKIGMKSGDVATPRELAACIETMAPTADKVAAAVASLQSSISSKCTAGARSDLFGMAAGACASEHSTAAALAGCVSRVLACRSCGLFAAADAISADCDLVDDGLANSSCTVDGCGDGMKDGGELCDASDSSPANQMCPNSGNGLETCSTYDCSCACPGYFDFTPDETLADSLLDRGWTGVSHDERWISDATVTVEVTSCEGATKPCGVCTFEGPVDNVFAAAGDIHNRRCTGDTAVTCTDDPDCSGAGGTCEFYFGAPLPLTDGATPVCVLQQIAGSITGTADVATGDAEIAMDVAWVVHTGIDVGQPCPLCVGDATKNDGVAGGTCDGGANHGAACDANGDSPVAGLGPTSLDCPPSAAANVSGSGLLLDLDAGTGTDTATLAASNPTCGAVPYTSLLCHCGVCDDGVSACREDADCVALGQSTCSSSAGEPTAPNACNDVTGCFDLGDNEGECSPMGPTDLFCDATPALRIPCTADTDCDLYDAFCPGADCGDCTATATRECFLTSGTAGDVIVGEGDPDVPANETSMPKLGASTCIGPTSNGTINAAAGMPGPVRLTLEGLARALPHQ